MLLKRGRSSSSPSPNPSPVPSSVVFLEISSSPAFALSCSQECSLPDTPEVNISTWEHTPTVRTRKHLHDGVDDRGGNQTAAASKAALTAETEDCPSLSGVSVEDVRSGNITLKLWDFGGTDEFHAVHGLFFSRWDAIYFTAISVFSLCLMCVRFPARGHGTFLSVVNFSNPLQFFFARVKQQKMSRSPE